MSMKELLAVLNDEVGEAAAIMSDALDRLRAGRPGDDEAGAAYQAAFEAYTEQPLRIAEVANLLELAGLATLLEQVVANLSTLTEAPPDAALSDLLGGWPAGLQTFLLHPHRAGTAEALVDLFTAPGWPFPLEPEVAAELKGQLRADIGHADAAADAEQQARRPAEATPADVALAFSPDVTPELLASFLAEAPGHAARYSQVIQQVIGGQADASTLDEARRVIHTLKGAANTLGVKGVATLCHHTEDVLQYLVQHGSQPPPALADLLQRVADALEAMLGSLLGEEEAPGGRIELLNEVLAWARRIDAGDDLGAAGAPISPAGGAEAPPELSPAVAPEAARPQTAATLHVPTAALDQLVRLAGEVTLSQRQMQGQVALLTERLREMTGHTRLLRQRLHELEEVVDIQGVSAGGAGRPSPHPQTAPGEARHPGFDTLELDRYNELHSHTHAFVEAFADAQTLLDQFGGLLAGLNDRLADQGRINADLHQGLLGARMVPAGQIASRLQRALRNTCQLTGRQARLELAGEEVMLDSYILTTIAEPLLHLLRNCIDHGIEPPAERAAAGKDPTGVIRIGFSHEGGKVSIRVADDGRGLDLARIRAKGIDRGLLTPEEPVTEQAIARLVLAPGFSTATAVTQVSGRGVGMDVVAATLERLKGSIAIQTQAGQGATFVLRLPFTLTRLDALLVAVGNDLVALPVDDIERVVHAGAAALVEGEGGWHYATEDETLPAVPLAEVLAYPTGRPLGGADDDRPLLLVHIPGGGRHALVVDRLVDSQELVLKSPGRYLGRLPGVIGVSILGDGRITPLIDVAQLLERHRVGAVARVQEGEGEEAPAPAEVLVVDDSLSVRQSLEQLLGDAGFAVRTARDGFDAIQAVALRMPMALLVDLEMPRMNGLELTEHLRAQPDSHAIPIIMITSRSQEKHRERARQAGVNAYLTKPYQDVELLGVLQSCLAGVTGETP